MQEEEAVSEGRGEKSGGGKRRPGTRGRGSQANMDERIERRKEGKWSRRVEAKRRERDEDCLSSTEAESERRESEIASSRVKIRLHT